MENTTQHNIQLIIKQVRSIKAGTDFITPSLWPPYSPDLNPVDFAVWEFCRTAFTGTVSRTWNSCAIALRSGTVLISE